MSGNVLGPGLDRAFSIPGLTYIRPIGSGGFADVSLHEREFPRQEVAVKVLRAKIFDEDRAAAFQREAGALAHLASHPSIVTIHDAGVLADGRPYMVMEYCPASLENIFRQRPLSVREVLDIGIKLACALETCHRAGMLHRDVKPSNLLITRYGRTVLSDFGVVGSARNSGPDTGVAASLPWSAPEVVRGHSSGSVASEIWSLCATLYALLAGRGPFERPGAGQNAQRKVVARILRARYAPLESRYIPPSIERVLAQGMSRNPKDRQASALLVAHQLRAIQGSLRVPLTNLEIIDSASVWAPGASRMTLGVQRSKVPVRSRRRRLGQLEYQ